MSFGNALCSNHKGTRSPVLPEANAQVACRAYQSRLGLPACQTERTKPAGLCAANQIKSNENVLASAGHRGQAPVSKHMVQALGERCHISRVLDVAG